MLLKGLYTIIDKSSLENSSITHTIVLNKKHQIFKGHFPSHPVLPGVVMLQLCKELFEGHTGEVYMITKTSRVKFLALVDPLVKNELIITQTFQEPTNSFNLKNSITFVNGTTVLKCNMVLAIQQQKTAL